MKTLVVTLGLFIVSLPSYAGTLSVSDLLTKMQTTKFSCLDLDPYNGTGHRVEVTYPDAELKIFYNNDCSKLLNPTSYRASFEQVKFGGSAFQLYRVLPNNPVQPKHPEYSMTPLQQAPNMPADAFVAMWRNLPAGDRTVLYCKFIEELSDDWRNLLRVEL